MLRDAQDPDALWHDLSRRIGPTRADQALAGFSRFMNLLRTYGWHTPLTLCPGARSVSEDERALARFVLHCAEQDHDSATAEAMMLVAPQAILPLVAAGERLGLPLLCEECRERARCPLTFQ
ncbi:hypothetical protein AL036_15650 [Salipiger aestuarii]|nr:hypothetical protein AL036_15650 [Salipiger aestuarii]KAA8614217.1 hypothetical protein AL037_04010 [Salipiger aestuarii]KAB2540856.1 hypothetical protein AL035_15490 [Salipiger aestuarii]